MSIAVLVDVSSSVVGTLIARNMCPEFYRRLLGFLRTLPNSNVYLFPHPSIPGIVIGRINFQSVINSDVFIENIVESICLPSNDQRSAPRGTPLIRAVHEVLGSDISTLVIVSDFLSDRSDDPGLITEVLKLLRQRNIWLNVIWMRRSPLPSESITPAFNLLRSIYEQQLGLAGEQSFTLDSFKELASSLCTRLLIGFLEVSLDGLSENILNCFIDNLSDVMKSPRCLSL